jgi:hypothetical protein
LTSLTEAGDGKSTIVKLLIEQQTEAMNQLQETNFPTPAVGTIGSSIPTSGDIHLYADPDSWCSQFPRLYADCEGLNGGEKTPMANRTQNLDDATNEVHKRHDIHTYLKPNRNILKKGARGAKRALKFATTPETREREYAVRELYSRFLYTFSDVVVFVLHNER